MSLGAFSSLSEKGLTVFGSETTISSLHHEIWTKEGINVSNRSSVPPFSQQAKTWMLSQKSDLPTHSFTAKLWFLDVEPAGPHDLALQHKEFEGTRVCAKDSTEGFAGTGQGQLGFCEGKDGDRLEEACLGCE